MPKLDLDMFDDAPKIGDKVKVMGKVKSIDEDSGEVTVTYDDVSIVKKSKKRRNNDDDDDVDVVFTEDMDEQMAPDTQSLDYALSRSFPNSQ